MAIIDHIKAAVLDLDGTLVDSVDIWQMYGARDLIKKASI